MSVPPESVIPPPPSEPPLAGEPSAEQRQWAMFAHISSLAGAILTGAFGGGWGCFIGPLIIWLMKKDTMPFVNDQGKEALNFNITVAIASLILLAIALVVLLLGIVRHTRKDRVAAPNDFPSLACAGVNSTIGVSLRACPSESSAGA